MLIIFRQPGANIIETVDNIKKQLPALKASIPFGIDVTTVLDRTTTIRASINDVERTLDHFDFSRDFCGFHFSA